MAKRIERRTLKRPRKSDPVEAVRSLLIEERYVASPLLAAQVYLLLGDLADARSVSAICVEGFPGTGKSSLATAFTRIRARLTSGPSACIKISVYGSTTVNDVMYRPELRTVEKVAIDPDVYDEIDWVQVNKMGALPAAFKLAELFPVTLMVDEFDKLSSGAPGEPSSVEAWLLGVLGDGKLPVKGQKAMSATLSNLAVFIGKNYRRDLTPELRRRARTVQVDFPPPDVEIPLLTGAMGPKQRSSRRMEVFAINQIFRLPPRLAEYLVLSIGKRIRSSPRHLTLIPPTEVLGRIGRDTLRLVAAGHPEMVEAVVRGWLIAKDEETQELYSVVTETALNADLVAVAQRCLMGPLRNGT